MSEEFESHRRDYHARRSRLRRFLRRLPRRGNVHRYPVLKWFGDMARSRPYLWSFKRRYVMPALYFGCVLSVLPVMGLQILLALILALLVRANLTLMVALQFITNPFTAVPVYGATYLLGDWLIKHTGYGEGIGVWGTRVNALFVGGIVGGLLLAFAIDILWRFLAWEARVFKARLDALHAAAEARRSAAHRHPGHGDHHR